MSFSADITKFKVTAKSNQKSVRDEVLLKLFTSVIRDTPVDTGRLRANWVTNIGSADLYVTGSTANGARNLAKAKLEGSQMEEPIYFTNNLHYAQAIEFGGSPKKAPEGMMRKNVIRFVSLIESQARKTGITQKAIRGIK